MRVQVCIIGGGPSGLLLGQLLHRAGIATAVLERRSRAHVLGRIRAGVLERGTVALLERAGVAARLHREGMIHDGTLVAYEGGQFRVDFAALTGSSVTVYGQTEVTRDLYDARAAAGARTVFGVADVTVEGADTDAPVVHYRADGAARAVACDFVAGCDGFHGVSRRTIPAGMRREYDRVHPHGWLGILSETPPAHPELVYAGSERGFALCSMRNAGLSRHYIQCAAGERAEDWSDAAFWDELRARLPAGIAEGLVTGPSIEKSVAPLRSFVCEPMRWGRLFLCGDAAHIVPPTGAKGLNTAASDVHYLHEALSRWYAEGDAEGIDRYSERALARVWQVERFSWWFSALLHTHPDDTPFDRRLRRAELDFLRGSAAARRVLAENYVGLPY